MCNRCNGTCTSCKCTCKKRCDCPVIISSACITSFTEELPCSGIPAGQTLNETLIALDASVCEKIEALDGGATLINIGTGSEVYKGVDLLGKKEIRKINAVGDLITVTQNTNDISISIDEEVLEGMIPEGLSLGDTETTAHRGDHGTTAYAHSQITSGNPHGTTLQTTTDSGNATTNAIAIGTTLTPSGFVKLRVRQNGTSGNDNASVFSGLSQAGTEFMKINEDDGVMCNTFTGYGLTATFGGNTNTVIKSRNPHTGSISIGDTTLDSVPNVLGRDFISFNQRVQPAVGTSDNLNYSIIQLTSTVDLTNQGGTGIVRGFYINPTLTGLTGTQTFRAIETVVGGAYFNTSSPQASAILQADSTTQGSLPYPRMTETQRLAISSPAVGLHVYQTDPTEGVYVYKSSGWTFAY